jgi:hypothetical protein
VGQIEARAQQKAAARRRLGKWSAQVIADHTLVHNSAHNQNKAAEETATLTARSVAPRKQPAAQMRREAARRQREEATSVAISGPDGQMGDVELEEPNLGTIARQPTLATVEAFAYLHGLLHQQKSRVRAIAGTLAVAHARLGHEPGLDSHAFQRTARMAGVLPYDVSDEELRGVFALLDDDSDGVVTMEELMASLRRPFDAHRVFHENRAS